MNLKPFPHQFTPKTNNCFSRESGNLCALIPDPRFHGGGSMGRDKWIASSAQSKPSFCLFLKKRTTLCDFSQ